MPTPIKQSPRPATKQAPKKGGSVLDRIGPVEFDADEGIKVLLYGRSGTGKTTFWTSFPGPILCAVCSGGFKPGELRSVPLAERGKIKTVTLLESGELKTLVEAASHIQYATLVLDHASGLQDLVLKEILGLQELPAQKGWGLATQQQYGQCTQQCKELLRAMLNLSCNVVIIAQERTFGEESVSELVNPTVGAALTPSLTGWLNPACDYVVQTFLRPRMVKQTHTIAGKQVESPPVRGRGVEYCLRTEPHDVYMTKFRVPKGKELPELIVDPTYAKIIKLING